MADTPLVTVVTVIYNLLKANRKEEFRQCMQSVREQTYAKIEHIIIDGASTDGTLDLLHEYEQEWGVKVYSEPDKGIYDAFNKGIARARGKYIAFLNSDDFWHDSRGVEESVRVLEEERADFSYAPSVSTEKKEWVYDNNISSFLFKTPFNHQTMFARTERLRQIGGFDLQYKVFADCDVMIRLLMKGAKAVRVPLCFLTFRPGGFWQSYDPVLLKQEKQTMYRNNFSSFLSEHEFVLLWDFKLSPHFRKVLRRKVHPVVYREIRAHFRWRRKEKVWEFMQDIPFRRSFRHRLADRIIYAVDSLLPRRNEW